MLFLATVSFLLLSCHNNNFSNAPIKTFEEEFINFKTVKEYTRFEYSTFGNSVFTPIEGNEEEEKKRSFVYSPYYLFEDKDVFCSCKVLTYKKRYYYTVFYSNKELITPNLKTTNDSYTALYNPDDYSILDDPYSDYVVFLNYDSLNEIKYIYNNFYLYNIICLVDVYEDNHFLSTTFEFVRFSINNSKHIEFYDLPNYYTNSYQPFDLKNRFFSYYDDTILSTKKLVPFFHQPYDHFSLMSSRVEIDDKYAYFPFSDKSLEWFQTIEQQKNVQLNVTLLTKETVINDYDVNSQKSTKKTIEEKFYRVDFNKLSSF